MTYYLSLITEKGTRVYPQLDGDEVFNVLTRLCDDFVTGEALTLVVTRNEA
jgi:hypothetical protein